MTLPVAEEDVRVLRITRLSDVTMKSAAAMVVALERTVAVPRGPKTVCEPIPPNAPARSAALPLCSKTTIIRKKQIIMCRAVKRYNMAALIIATGYADANYPMQD